MNIQMQTADVFSAPLVAITKINFLKAVTELWVITLTVPKLMFFSVTIQMKSDPQS